MLKNRKRPEGQPCTPRGLTTWSDGMHAAMVCARCDCLRGLTVAWHGPGQSPPHPIPQLVSHRIDILIATAGEVQDHLGAGSQCGAEGFEPGEGMGRLQGGNDAFKTA